ncbi:MAG: DUF1573 domain-containing protein [Planctomycetia bacterium]|nr:DUF1573 domain-containing protein [Planctomycetia bacterium]
MRISIVAMLAVVLGVGIGMAATLSEFGSSGDERPTLATSGSPLLPVVGPPPKVVLIEPHYEFGEMDQDDVGRHTFVLRNDGPGVLSLDKGTPSCKCTIASISTQSVEPGQTADIAVEWKPAYVSGEFGRSITFHTNDPAKPVVAFEIHGQVLTTFRLDPSAIVMGSVSPKESREATAKLFAFKDSNFEILGHEFGSKPTAEHFGFLYEPLPPEELAKVKAKSGYLLTVVVREGMPIGPLIQTLTIKTSLNTKTPITLPIYGQIAPEISLVGPSEFNHEKNILFMGVTPKGKGHAVQLRMFLCGPRRSDVKFTVDKVVPGDLKVNIGKPTPLPGGTSMQVPILVEVPNNAQPVALMGTTPEEMGQIVLHSNHPDYKELKINVRMAVTDDASATPLKMAKPAKAPGT